MQELIVGIRLFAADSDIHKMKKIGGTVVVDIIEMRRIYRRMYIFFKIKNIGVINESIYA